jgi:hypothetical protein
MPSSLGSCVSSRKLAAIPTGSLDHDIASRRYPGVGWRRASSWPSGSTGACGLRAARSCWAASPACAGAPPGRAWEYALRGSTGELRPTPYTVLGPERCRVEARELVQLIERLVQRFAAGALAVSAAPGLGVPA